MTSYYGDPDAPTPSWPRRIGVTALIERETLILVERRVDDPDRWAFIGGTLEEDERVLDFLEREVVEETGFAIGRAVLLGVFSDPTRIVAYPDGGSCRVGSIPFRATPDAGEPNPSDDSGGMRFVTRDELFGMPCWPEHHPIREAFPREPSTPVVE